MKKLLTVLAIGLISLNSFSQCTKTYNNQTFPSTSVIVHSGEVICIDEDMTTPTNSGILVYAGGKIIIKGNSVFRVKGSLTVHPGGQIEIQNCSKIIVDGSYTGGTVDDCDISIGCSSFDEVNYSDYVEINGASAFLDACKSYTLPVELISLDCKKGALNWSTASEINSSFFTVKFSKNGYNFKEIGKVDAMGNSFDITNYTFNVKEKGYYLLSQTDIDGTVEIFNIVTCLNMLRHPYIVARYNTIGQAVSSNYKGTTIKIYSDGTKTINK